MQTAAINAVLGAPTSRRQMENVRDGGSRRDAGVSGKGKNRALWKEAFQPLLARQGNLAGTGDFLHAERPHQVDEFLHLAFGAGDLDG